MDKVLGGEGEKRETFPVTHTGNGSKDSELNDLKGSFFL
jgi:hypothetical protein